MTGKMVATFEYRDVNYTVYMIEDVMVNGFFQYTIFETNGNKKLSDFVINMPDHEIPAWQLQKIAETEIDSKIGGQPS